MAAPGLITPTILPGSVFVIDDDASVRRALTRQLRAAGFQVEAFASAQDYLDQPPREGIACIVTDLRMPGLSGLDLQASLAKASRELPIVFITGYGDVPTSVRAMKAGAVNFLPKPFSDDEILAAVAEALERSARLDSARKADAELRAHYQALTPREREVFVLVAAGLLNKIVADRLHIAEKTVKVHRHRVMEKMGAASIADLVRMAEHLALSPVPPSERS
jgi:FixJ family two-component response regulator